MEIYGFVQQNLNSRNKGVWEHPHSALFCTHHSSPSSLHSLP